MVFAERLNSVMESMKQPPTGRGGGGVEWRANAEFVISMIFVARLWHSMSRGAELGSQFDFFFTKYTLMRL